LAICCWPKRIASRRSHRIVQQSEPSNPGIIVGLASEERAVGADDHPSSKVNHGTDDERRAVRIVGTRDHPSRSMPDQAYPQVRMPISILQLII
jgi:hypothetical protein